MVIKQYIFVYGCSTAECIKLHSRNINMRHVDFVNIFLTFEQDGRFFTLKNYSVIKLS